ncbi:DEAD/DEAH box helicase [Anaerosporobacter sp.]
MQLTISNEITIEDPSNQLLAYCEKNLVIPNPDFTKKKRMGMWIGNTPDKIYLYRIDGNKLIIPTGAGKQLRQYIKIENTTVDLANNNQIDYKAKLPLYDYQEPAVMAMIKASCGILQAPCGSGKTQMGIAIATELNQKTLWLTHTQDLLNQSYERAAQYIDKKLLGTITAGKVNIGTGITFATVQTLSKLDLSQFKYSFDVIIVDECHRCAGTPTSVSMFSKVINSLAARHKYGLSATVHRGDGLIKSTFALLGPVIYEVPESAVADKTMKVTVEKIKTGTEVAECCLDTDGTLIYQELIKYLAENVTRNRNIAENIVINFQQGHSCLVLSDRLEHLQSIMRICNECGVSDKRMRFINGKMTSKKAKAERVQALEDMRNGKAKVLFASYSLAKEGLDIPQLDRLFLALPKKDYAVVTQSIGRIGRTADGKKDAICLDYVDDIGFCENAWKKRKTSYRKKGCVIHD